MPFGLGFFATAGAGAAGSFDLLETQVLGTSQSSVTFSSLSTYSTYKHLQIRWVSKSTRAGFDGDDLFWQMNGNTTSSNYTSHYLRGSGSTVSSAANNNSIYYGLISNFIPAGNYTNEFMAGVTDILDAFQTTKNKTVRTFAGAITPSYAIDTTLSSGMFLSTDAVSSFTLKCRLANIAAGSRFSLYGLKGS
jgi:hypothetical protein